MVVSYKIDGKEKLLKKLSLLSSEGNKKNAMAVLEGTLLIHETAVKLIQENTDGTPQRRYKPNRTVAVSHPGDPPNTDTGRLVQSIKIETSEKGLVGRVGTNLKYGAMLEFGTKVMAPRPWLSRAVADTKKQIGDIFKATISSLIKDVTK